MLAGSGYEGGAEETARAEAVSRVWREDSAEGQAEWAMEGALASGGAVASVGAAC